MSGGPQSESTTAPASGPSANAVKQHARAEFEKWAHTYDHSRLNEVVFFPSIRACQEEIVQWNAARGGGRYRMLDVGCGTGSLLSRVAADADAELMLGLDYTKEMVRRCAAKFATCDAAQRMAALNGDAERLPLADASVDVVTCCNSFHHYPHQAAAVREFRRVLRPGGMLVLIDGFRDNVIGWLVFDVGVATVERNVHHAAWSAVRRMTQEAGFPAVRQRKINVFAPLLVTVATA